MKTGQFGVVTQVQGKRPNFTIVGSGANVASALRAIKLDPEKYAKGGLTLNDKAITDLTIRLKTNDLLAVVPDVAGGKA